MSSEKFGITNHIVFENDIENYPSFVTLHSKHGTCKLALHGGHVLSYIPKGSHDILWLSEKALYQQNKAIRGGIPLCFPWFSTAFTPSHGFARLMEWEVVQNGIDEACNPQIVLRLESTAWSRELWGYDFSAELSIKLSKDLEMVLSVKNNDTKAFTIEEAMHSYYHVSDIKNVSVFGLEKKVYSDSLDANKEKSDDTPIQIDAEIDRIYEDTPECCIIRDRGLNREIIISKENSLSTIVWNPWREKSASMSDFNEGGYKQMLCVESGNIGKNKVIIKGGETRVMKMWISEKIL